MHLFIKLADYYEVSIDYLAGIDKNDYNEYLTKQKEISYFYQKIRDIREDNDMNQQQVADILGITRQQYQLYESGKREMPMHHFITLAEHYGVTIDYLVGRDKRNLFEDI
ncbi:MAG: helix-turn-helix transcriptional regulator [Ruminococcus sp.]|nr:helix-turn-helix transcriptional regulator [Ruminococcus sp.]